jgi:hypothetical protein
MGKFLSEFETMDHDDQAWAIAVWRTKAKIRAIEALEQHRKSQ